MSIKYSQQILENYSMVVSELKKGESLRQICKVNDLDYFAFYKKIKKDDPDILSRNWTSDVMRKRMSAGQKIVLDTDLIIDMYTKDLLSARKIAEHFNVVQNTILRILRDNNVPKNSQKLYWTDDKREAQRQLCYDGVIGIHAQGDGAYRFTKPERDFAQWCEDNNVPYTRQYQIEKGMHNYDFKIEGTNLIVEIDGVYWHSTPEQKLKDLQFEEEANKNGLTLLRFSDIIINQTKTQCFEEVLTYMKGQACKI